MAKIKESPILADDIREYLDETSDFAFELRVLEALRDRGFDCEHGGHYTDPVTGKSREFDIRAKKKSGDATVRLAVECKNVRPNFPLLVHCTPREESESFHQIALLRELGGGTTAVSRAANSLQSRALPLSLRDPNSIYGCNDPVGKSTAQIGRASTGTIVANDSGFYEKWGQCLGSAERLVSSMYWDGKEDESRSVHYSIVIPFVTLPDERLWNVLYRSDGSLFEGPCQVDRVSCFVDKHYTIDKLGGRPYRLSHIEIVTVQGLLSFVAKYLSPDRIENELFPQHAVREALSNRR